MHLRTGRRTSSPARQRRSRPGLGSEAGVYVVAPGSIEGEPEALLRAAGVRMGVPWMAGLGGIAFNSPRAEGAAPLPRSPLSEYGLAIAAAPLATRCCASFRARPGWEGPRALPSFYSRTLPPGGVHPKRCRGPVRVEPMGRGSSTSADFRAALRPLSRSHHSPRLHRSPAILRSADVPTTLAPRPAVPLPAPRGHRRPGLRPARTGLAGARRRTCRWR